MTLAVFGDEISRIVSPQTKLCESGRVSRFRAAYVRLCRVRSDIINKPDELCVPMTAHRRRTGDISD